MQRLEALFFFFFRYLYCSQVKNPDFILKGFVPDWLFSCLGGIEHFIYKTFSRCWLAELTVISNERGKPPSSLSNTAA